VFEVTLLFLSSPHKTHNSTKHTPACAQQKKNEIAQERYGKNFEELDSNEMKSVGKWGEG